MTKKEGVNTAIDLFKKYTKGNLSTIININGYRIRVERKGRKVKADEILKRN